MVPPGTDLIVTDSSRARSQLLDPTWRNDTYRFCEQQCNVFTFRLMDSLDHRINAESLQLEGGSCEDTFWAGQATWDVARTKPPAPLVQFYVECVNTLFQSVIVSFGSAAGTAAPITAAFVMLIVTMMGRIWEWQKRRRGAVAGGTAGEVDEETGSAGKDSVADEAMEEVANVRVAPTLVYDVCMDLKRHWVMGEFSMYQLRQLVQRSAVVGYRVGEVVYASGDAVHCAYYVLSGAYRISPADMAVTRGQVRITVTTDLPLSLFTH